MARQASRKDRVVLQGQEEWPETGSVREDCSHGMTHGEALCEVEAVLHLPLAHTGLLPLCIQNICAQGHSIESDLWKEHNR